MTEPAVRGLQLYQKHFPNSREPVVTVCAPDAEADEIAARLLAEPLSRETHLVTSANAVRYASLVNGSGENPKPAHSSIRPTSNPGRSSNVEPSSPGC